MSALNAVVPTGTPQMTPVAAHGQAVTATKTITSTVVTGCEMTAAATIETAPLRGQPSRTAYFAAWVAK